MRKTVHAIALIAALGYAFGLGWEIALAMIQDETPEEETIGRQGSPVLEYVTSGLASLEAYLEKCARLAEYESRRDAGSAPPAAT